MKKQIMHLKAEATFFLLKEAFHLLKVYNAAYRLRPDGERPELLNEIDKHIKEVENGSCEKET